MLWVITSMFGTITSMSSALGEEIGWRGFLTPELYKNFGFTKTSLFTGAIWGKPIWGTYWAWDPRLTSFAILLMFYLGYLSIWQTMKFSDKIGDLSSWLCIVGSIFALLSRYAVFFWDQGLHQGPSLSLDKEENIDNVFYFPLIICIIGFVLLFLTLLLIRIKTEIQKRKINILLNARDV